MGSTFKIATGLRFVINGAIFEVEKFIGPEQFRILNINTGVAMPKSRDEFLRDVTQKRIQILDKSGLTKTTVFETSIPEEFKLIVKRRLDYIKAIQKENPTNLSRTNLIPVIEKVSRELNDENPPSYSSVYRWLRLMTQHEDVKALVPKTKNRGNETKRKGELTYSIMENCINEYYLRKERPSIKTVLDIINAEIDEENQITNKINEVKHVSYKMLKSAIKNLNQYEVVKARFGERFAEQKFKLSEGGASPTRILERVEMDHTKVDLFIVDGKTGLVYGKPWFTVALDVYSRCILGFHIGFDPPSAASVQACLGNAIWSKDYVKNKFEGILNEWPAVGVPETLYLDNGKEFIGSNLEVACMELGINIQYCPVQNPWYKGSVERFFKSINLQLLHNLPGTSFSNIFEKGDYDPKENAIVSYDFLLWLVHKWVIDVYHQAPHRTIRTSPSKLWEKGSAEFNPRYVSSLDFLNTIMSYTVERTVGRTGIQLHNLEYRCPEIAHLRTITTNNGKVKVKYNPQDLGAIQVFDPSQDIWIYVPALDQNYASQLSLWQHKIHMHYAKEQFNDIDLAALRKAKKEIFDEVSKHMKNIKKTGAASKVARYLKTGANDIKMIDEEHNLNNTKEKSSKKAKSAKQMLSPLKDHPSKGVADLPSAISELDFGKPVNVDDVEMNIMEGIEEQITEETECLDGFEVTVDLPQKGRR